MQVFTPPPSNWDFRHLEHAKYISQYSKDPSTKTGAVLVRPDQTIASVGFNGFAKGMSDAKELYDNREIKYSRVIHCEMNALLFCRDPIPLIGYTLYTTGPCCDRCCVHMIQAGIRRFVFAAPTPEQYTRWNVARTMDYFKEVNAEVIQL